MNNLRTTSEGDILNFWDLIISSIGFSLGFSLMFFLISIPFLGLSQVEVFKNYLRILGGIILIFFGLVLLNLINIPFLKKYFKFVEVKREEGKKKEKKNIFGMLFSSIIVGISFSSGWAPCVGPVMISVISIISNQEKFMDGIFLSLVMSLGLMSGFLLTSVLVYFIKGIIKTLSKISVIMEKILGIVFILMGLILISSKINLILSLGIGTDLLEKFSYNITSLTLTSILVSFISGFFIFLSPCTLPLVIPYLIYITGISFKK